MASFDIGAKLRQERVGRGLALGDISGNTRIPLRFLQAIEGGDFTQLPGLIFTRNFVKQYALALKLDPDPLLAELPRQDESTVQLPDPPAHPRSSYHRDRAMRSLVSSFAWIVLAGGAGYAAYLHFNHTLEPSRATAATSPVESYSTPSPGVVNAPPPITAPATTDVPQDIQVAKDANTVTQPPIASAVASPQANPMPVQVSMTAHEASWVQITADGKPAFTGTLQSNETRQISALEQVKILTGNAGGLTISLNGKTLDPLGPSGQIRTVRLTAEGPQLLSKAPEPVYDPL